MAARRFEMLDRMEPELQALAISQGGVLTRAQALDGGVPLRQLGSPSRPRLLVRVRPGVYAEASSLEQLDEPGRVALSVAAERVVSEVDLVAAGATGALVHELPLLGERPARPFLVERKPERPAHHGNSRTVAADETVLVHGVPVTTLARTAVDVARHRGFAAGVITADAVLRREVPRTELEAVLGRCLRWPSLFAAQRSVAFADALSESALESLGRVRFHEQGLPAPQLQVWLGGPDGRIGRVDQYWPEHRTIAEADGALKYAAGTGLFAEKLREDRLRDAGFEVIRYTWDEALRYPQLLAIRVREAFARAARRRVG